MSAPQATQKKTSKLLVALDNSATLFDNAFVVPGARAAQGGLKRSSPTPGPEATRRNKRRATGMGIAEDAMQIAGIENLAGAGSTAMGSSMSGSPTRRSHPGGISAGFSLNYDDESMIHKIDIGGEDQALKMAEFVTKTIDNSSHGLTVQKSMEKLGLEDKKDLLFGMEVRLLPHQIIGVSWMLDQELNTTHKGGILADDMGLGKTVQMIATMAMNMPGEHDKHKTTLIVVPAALLVQWKEELQTKTNDIFSVHLQHGKEKLKNIDALREKDVIITTYQTLNMDFSVPSGIDKENEEEWILGNGGPLARMKWFRVITDESQFIRNRATRSSKAVAMLRAKYRWCLTGTPVTNTLADIYGLLRFGHFRPWNDWADFNEYVAKMQLEDAPLAGLRAQEILKPLLLRRTKNSELEGRPLLELPEKHVDLVTLEFSNDERDIYDHVERRAQIQINRFITQGTIVKNHSYVLVLILRLRQLCCHPNLILSREEASEDPSMVIANLAEKEFARAVKVMGARWATEMKIKFLDRAKAALTDYEEDELEAPEGDCPVCGEMFVNNSGRVLACGHEVCFDCLRELANSAIVHDGVFGYGDEQSNNRVEAAFENAAAKGLRPCPTCKKMNAVQQKDVFFSVAFQPTSDELKRATRRKYPGPTASAARVRKEEAAEVIDVDSGSESSSDDDLPDISTILKNHAAAKTKRAGKGKGRAAVVGDGDVSMDDDDVRGRGRGQGKGHPRDDTPEPASGAGPSNDVLATWRAGGENLEPSAKMMALVGLLQEWESTGDKTICFSQWTSMLDLIESLFSRYGIQTLRYDGSMNQEARQAVLSRFRKPGGPKVILISTKCGGVGLNLTSANRIINLDLSWNYASESQAYDRVHRLGQEKEVFVKRLVVKDTIEERMLKLQDTKTGLAEAALGEGSGVKLHKLSVKELKDLFGMSKRNDNANNNRNQGNSRGSSP